jgi:hypothetical protein
MSVPLGKINALNLPYWDNIMYNWIWQQVAEASLMGGIQMVARFWLVQTFLGE